MEVIYQDSVADIAVEKDEAIKTMKEIVVSDLMPILREEARQDNSVTPKAFMLKKFEEGYRCKVIDFPPEMVSSENGKNLLAQTISEAANVVECEAVVMASDSFCWRIKDEFRDSAKEIWSKIKDAPKEEKEKVADCEEQILCSLSCKKHDFVIIFRQIYERNDRGLVFIGDVEITEEDDVSKIEGRFIFR